MTYTKNTWTDEALAGPERYDIKTNAGAAIESNVQIELITAVTTAGTAVDADKMNNIEDGIEALDLLLSSMRAAATELTIASDAVTITQSNHKLQPQSGTADNLSTISGTTAGQFGVLYCTDYGTDTITIKHNVGNILCMGAADISLSQGCVFWYSDGTKVFISGGGSGGGGGSFTYPSTELTSPAPDDQVRIFKDVSTGSDVFITLQNLLKYGANLGSRTTYTVNTPATLTLTDSDPMLIALYGASPGDVVLPPPGSSNHVFIFYGDAEGWWNVKNHAGLSIGFVPSLETRIVLPINEGNYWTMIETSPRAYAANDMIFGYSNGTYGSTWQRKSLSDSKTILGILTTDTDGTLAANSDTKTPTQKAVKTYVDTAVTGLLDFKGATDASTNPNYPSASKGDAYVVSVAGKIGGASGKSVDSNDVYLAIADNAGGTEASVGTSWIVLEHNLVGALLSANNLSDLTNQGTARTNLGMSANGSSLVTAANYATMLSLLGALPVAGGTLTGEVDLGENAGLVFDAALSADGKYSGMVRAGTAGATLAFGDLCYLAAADSRWELVDANAESTSGGLLGMCVLAAAADGSATKMLMLGFIRADAAFPALTIGAKVFASTTAGDVQTTAPSGAADIIRVVGYADTADSFFFNPSADYYEHA